MHGKMRDTSFRWAQKGIIICNKRALLFTLVCLFSKTNLVVALFLGKDWMKSVISREMNANVTMTVKMMTSVVLMDARKTVQKFLVKNMVNSITKFAFNFTFLMLHFAVIIDDSIFIS